METISLPHRLLLYHSTKTAGVAAVFLLMSRRLHPSTGGTIVLLFGLILSRLLVLSDCSLVVGALFISSSSISQCDAIISRSTLSSSSSTSPTAAARRSTTIGVNRHGSAEGSSPESLSSHLDHVCADDELRSCLYAVAEAVAEVARELARLPLTVGAAIKNSQEPSTETARSTVMTVHGEEQTGMDVVANDIFCKHFLPVAAALASEKEEDILMMDNKGHSLKRFEVAFDPLDGSSNLDCSIPTGSIFGIAPHHVRSQMDDIDDSEGTLNMFTQSGRHLVAADYSVYSSSTELVISLGHKTVGFTLDPSLYKTAATSSASSDSLVTTAADAFLMSRPHIQCPEYGPYYSLNEAREPDWPDGLRRWIHDAKRGRTASSRFYSSRYVCSLCADVHRTLLHGGWTGNPRPHLRLLYEAAPLAFLREAAGGRGSDGIDNLLDVVPTGLHDRVCVFLGGGWAILPTSSRMGTSNRVRRRIIGNEDAKSSPTNSLHNQSLHK